MCDQILTCDQILSCVTSCYLRVRIVNKDEGGTAPEVAGPALHLHEARLALHPAALYEHPDTTFDV